MSAALGQTAERALAEVLGEEQYAGLVRMFQIRHVYEHNLGVVDAEAIKKAPDLAAWRGRKYVLARKEVEAFLRSLEEVYDVVVRLLDDVSGKGNRDRTAHRPQPPAERRDTEEHRSDHEG